MKKHIPLLLILLFAGWLLYLPAELGSALTVAPDSDEYCISLANLIEHGRFGFLLNGTWYPSRYSPWFSITCLLPTYILCGGNILCLHFAILAFTLSFLALSWKMARELHLGCLSYFIPFTFLFSPDFVLYARTVMTEIPYTAVLAASALVFVRFAKRPLSIQIVILAGILVTWCGIIRSTGMPMILPFVVAILYKQKNKREIVRFLCILTAPLILYEVGNMVYNCYHFGSPFRSGYNFWLPIPHEYPNLVFNIRYLSEFKNHYLANPLFQVFLFMIGYSTAFAFFQIRNHKSGQHVDFILLWGFFLYQALILLTLYSAYYFWDTRFFLPATLCFVPIFLYAIKQTPLRSKTFSWSASAISAVLIAACFLSCKNDYESVLWSRSLVIGISRAMHTIIPDHSIIICKTDPNLLEYFGVAERDVQYIPFDREFDYSGHIIAKSSLSQIPLPTKRDVYYCQELVDSGICSTPYEKVFAEHAEECLHSIGDKRCFTLPECLQGMDDILSRNDCFIQEWGTWEIPELHGNPIREFHDRLLFQKMRFDSRPRYYLRILEIRKTSGTTINPTSRKDYDFPRSYNRS